MNYKSYLDLEQASREIQVDQVSLEWGCVQGELAEMVRLWGKLAILNAVELLPEELPAPVPPRSCQDCLHWRQSVPVLDGEQPVADFCQHRAELELSQLSPKHAKTCPVFVEKDSF